MKKNQKKYFLGANSCEGFVSVFNECFDPYDGWKAYIIKGGPGTGKSSFMKYMISIAEKNNIEAELFPCSSDPDSLDAVIFPDKKTVIMDGTAPHTVDPKYPAICETILNFGEFWNNDIFKEKSQEIITVTDKNKQLHKSASRYIKAVGNLIEDNLKIAESVTNKQKVTAFADKLCQKYLPKKDGKAKEWMRFLSGITPKGVVFYGDTPIKSYKTTVIIEDEYGSVSKTLMQRIRNYALEQNYEIITVKSGFLPSLFIDHIIIPELSLAFVSENEYRHFNTDLRRIHARRFIDLKRLNKSHERLKFNKKAIRQLLLSACGVLADAKSVHDELENYYISSMDFEALTDFANNFAKKLFECDEKP